MAHRVKHLAAAGSPGSLDVAGPSTQQRLAELHLQAPDLQAWGGGPGDGLSTAITDAVGAHSPRLMEGLVHGLHGHDPTTSPTPTTIEEVHDQMDELADFLRAKMQALSSHGPRATDRHKAFEHTSGEALAGGVRPSATEEIQLDANPDLEPGYRARRSADGLLEAAAGQEHDPPLDAAAPKQRVALEPVAAAAEPVAAVEPADAEDAGAEDEALEIAMKTDQEHSEASSAPVAELALVPEGMPPAEVAPTDSQPSPVRALLNSALYPEHDSPVARAQRASSELERLLSRSSAQTAAASPRRLAQQAQAKAKAEAQAAAAAQPRVPLTSPRLSATTHGAASAASEAAKLAKQRAATQAAVAAAVSPAATTTAAAAAPDAASIQDLLHQRQAERDDDIIHRSARRQAEYQPSDSPRFFGRQTSPTTLAKHADASAATAAATAERLLSSQKPPAAEFSLVEDSGTAIGREALPAAAAVGPTAQVPTTFVASGGVLSSTIDWSALRSPQSVATTLSPSSYGVTSQRGGGEVPAPVPEPAPEPEPEPAPPTAAEVQPEPQQQQQQPQTQQEQQQAQQQEQEGEDGDYHGRSPFLWRDATPKTAHLAWTPTRESTLRVSPRSTYEKPSEVTARAQPQPQPQIQVAGRRTPSPTPVMDSVRESKQLQQHGASGQQQQPPPQQPLVVAANRQSQTRSPSSEKAAEADQRLQSLLATASPHARGGTGGGVGLSSLAPASIDLAGASTPPVAMRTGSSPAAAAAGSGSAFRPAASSSASATALAAPVAVVATAPHSAATAGPAMLRVASRSPPPPAAAAAGRGASGLDLGADGKSKRRVASSMARSHQATLEDLLQSPPPAAV
jgi:hypothetical protein